MTRSLLWVSDGPSLATGFAKASREIVKRLAGAYDYRCTWGAWFEPQRAASWNGYPIRVEPLPHTQAEEEFVSLATAVKPDAVVVLADPWMIEWLQAPMSRLSSAFVGYCPIDGAPVSYRWHSLLHSMDSLVVPSSYASAVVSEELPDVPTEMIPHGVDVDTYRPVADRGELRRRSMLKYGANRLSLEDKFVVGCVARNQPRKQLPILVKAFAQFSQNHPDAVLIIHTAPYDTGWDLPDLLRRYGITGRAALTGPPSPHQGVPEEEMAMLYNLFDVFVLPTMGEGFGLPLLEAMACGVPVIATACSAVRELVQGRGELIAVKEWITTGAYNIEQAMADGDHLVRLMEKLYDDPALRAEYGRRARAFAETLTWDSTMPAWDRTLRRVTGDSSVPITRPSGRKIHPVAAGSGPSPLVRLLVPPAATHRR